MNPHIVFHFLLSGGRVETKAWTEEQTYREEDTGSTLGRFWNLSLFFFFLLILSPSVNPREEPRLLWHERASRPPWHKGSENQCASEKGSTKRFFKLFFDVTVSSIDLEILFSKRTLTCKLLNFSHNVNLIFNLTTYISRVENMFSWKLITIWNLSKEHTANNVMSIVEIMYSRDMNWT